MDLTHLPRRAAALARYLAFSRGRDRRGQSVRDYRRLVAWLILRYPWDEAMQRAVGGDYAEMGAKQVAVLAEAGLADGDRVLDMGCGSGRLAHALSGCFEVSYLGLDIVPELLAYARSRTPASYRFELSETFAVPAVDASFDLACAFSLFTHLQHEETFLYLKEAARVLRPSGVLAFSFLEFAEPLHWREFDATVVQVAADKRAHLNVFIERPVIALWAKRLGFEVERIVGPGEASAAGAIGQSVAILRRRPDG